MITEDVRRSLQECEIYVQVGGFWCDFVDMACDRRPFLAIWHESEDPSPEEMEQLKQFANALAEKFYGRPINDRSEMMNKGVNAITLQKEKGAWKHHLRSWSSGMGYQGPRWVPVNSGLTLSQTMAMLSV